MREACESGACDASLPRTLIFSLLLCYCVKTHSMKILLVLKIDLTPLPDAVACKNFAPGLGRRFAAFRGVSFPLGSGAGKDGCFRRLQTQGLKRL